MLSIFSRLFRSKPQTYRRSAKVRDKSPERGPARHRFIPMCEGLETRLTPAAYPFTFVNNTGLDASDIGIVIFGQDVNNVYYTIDASGAAATTGSSGSVTPMTLQDILDANSNTPTLNITDTLGTTGYGLQSGRMYIGLNPDSTWTFTLQSNGSVTTPVAGSTTTIFDYIELTLNANLSPAVTGNFNVDTTNVDGFGLPIKLDVQNSTTVIDGQTLSTVGIDISRAQVIADYLNFTSAADDPYAVLASYAPFGAYGQAALVSPRTYLSDLYGIHATTGLFGQGQISAQPNIGDTQLQLLSLGGFPGYVEALANPGVQYTLPASEQFQLTLFPDATPGNQVTVTVTALTVNADGSGTVFLSAPLPTPPPPPPNSQAYTNGAAVWLTSPISATQQSIRVTGAKITPPGASTSQDYPFPTTPFLIQIGAEYMQVTAVQQNPDTQFPAPLYTLMVTRGVNSTAAAHSANPAAITSVTLISRPPLGDVFNGMIDAFFLKYYDPVNPGATLTITSSVALGGDQFQGSVQYVAPGAAAPGDPNSYWVFRFTNITDTSDTMVYDVLYPFFTDNAVLWTGYTPQLKQYNAITAAPGFEAPFDIANLSPSQMVFATNGVFSDSATTGPVRSGMNVNQAAILADLENQIVSALNRGVALAADGAGNAAWDGTGSNPYYTTGPGNNNTGVWNRYAEFLHQATVSIPGPWNANVGLNYGFGFDDQQGQSSDIEAQNNGPVTITLGTLGTQTTTVLTSNPTTWAANTATTFTATVSDSSATGNVQFLLDGVPVGAPVALAAGVAATNFAAELMTPGSHTVTANYLGDATFLGSQGTLTQTVNAAPLLFAPAQGALFRNGSFTFANGSLITAADLDAGGENLTVTLTVTRGTLALGGVADLAGVTGNTTAAITLSGTLAALNAALNGLVYTPTPNTAGADSLAITVDDGGSGGGSPEQAAVSVPLTVAARPPRGRNFSQAAAYVAAFNRTLAVPEATGLLSNVVSPDGATPLTIRNVTSVSGPAVAPNVNTTTGAFSITPPPTFRGNIVFSYTVFDGLVESEPFTVTVAVGLFTKMRR